VKKSSNPVDRLADYDVGYKKPPKEHQYKPGQSGNRSGRPKRCDDLSHQFRRVLKQRAKVMENGRQAKILKTEIAMTQALNKAAAGDLKAFQAILKASESLGVTVEENEDGTFNLIIEGA
jgi:hypothetical protein